MTLEEFRRLTDTWGADIERWPVALRPAARQIALSDEGSSILAAAAELDALLATRPPVSQARADRAARSVTIAIAEATNRQRDGGWSWSWPSWLVPAASVACAALIGISLAILMPPDDQEATILAMILDSGSMATSWTLQ